MAKNEDNEIELSTLDLIIIQNALERAFSIAVREPDSFAAIHKDRIKELVISFAEKIKQRLS